MSADALTLRRAMVARLNESGDLPDPAWQHVFTTVARHLFLPDRFWAAAVDDESLSEYHEVNRETDPDEWLRFAYAEVAAVTQFDNGPIGAPPQGDAAPTSSASQPGAVAKMLAELDLRDGHRVLEIGTGTGYNAALLAERLGEECVTTVEVDEAVVTTARRNLAVAGCRPHVIHADGLDGYPAGAPYDRVIATASATHVPYTWISQSRPGAVIVLPRANPLYPWGTLRLTVADDGVASGPFVGLAGFMPLRAQAFSAENIKRLAFQRDQARDSVTHQDPAKIFDDQDALFNASIHLSDVCYQRTTRPDSHTVTFWLADIAGQSWATVDHDPAATVWPVRQHGPRDLWAEIEAAHGWWVEHDTPAWDWFGLTVTPEGQHVWYDTPDSGYAWPAPRPWPDA